MRIIVKYLYKSLTEKKARTFLVLFSIAASASLIFANEGFKRTVTYMFYEADTRYAGNSDICIEVKTEVGSKEWVDPDLLEEYKDEFTYAHSFIIENALYAPNVDDMYYYKIYGVHMDEFQQHNPFELKEGDYGNWSGYKVVMGEVYAEKYGFSIGDIITLEMNGRKYDFTVVGIAKQQGIYLREQADGGLLFAPKETIADIFGGDANHIYIKVKDKLALLDLMGRLKDTFFEYQVLYTVDENLIKAETSSYVLPFRISSIAVIFMSIFIIYTGFGLITTERISSLGSLRSLGATRRKLNRILLAESVVIGVIGGLIGCVFGIGVLRFIKETYFKADGTFANSATIVFGGKEIMTAVLAAVLITAGSAILSIRRTTKLQIKEIILNRPEQKNRKNSKLWIIGIILFGACIVIPAYVPINLFGMIIGGTLAVGVLVGLVFILPWLVGILAEAAGKLGLSQEVYLGIRNVKDNKALASNLQLFATMIAIVAFMVSIFNSMSTDLHNSYEKKNLFDVSFTLRESGDECLARIKAVDGVSNAVGYYKSNDCDLSDQKVFLNVLYGIEDSTFFDMNVVGGLSDAKEALDTLNEGNNIITTNILRSKLGLELGDIVKIKYGDKVQEFRITGFVDTNNGIGHVGYISGNNFKEFIGKTNYDYFVVKGNVDPDMIKMNLKREFTKDILSIDTKDEMEQANADKVDSIFKAINVYTYFAVVIGLLGMINNILAGFIERKRSLALYRCIGMSKKGTSKMMLTEAITVGIVGSLSGLISAVIMMKTIPLLVGMMWGDVAVKPAIAEIAVLCIGGLFAMILVSAIPLRNSGKISIIKSLRYE